MRKQARCNCSSFLPAHLLSNLNSWKIRAECITSQQVVQNTSSKKGFNYLFNEIICFKEIFTYISFIFWISFWTAKMGVILHIPLFLRIAPFCFGLCFYMPWLLFLPFPAVSHEVKPVTVQWRTPHCNNLGTENRKGTPWGREEGGWTPTHVDL